MSHLSHNESCLAHLAQIAPAIWDVATKGIGSHADILQVAHIAPRHRQGPCQIVALDAHVGQL